MNPIKHVVVLGVAGLILLAVVSLRAKWPARRMRLTLFGYLSVLVAVILAAAGRRDPLEFLYGVLGAGFCALCLRWPY